MKWNPSFFEDVDFVGSRMPIVLTATAEGSDPVQFASEFYQEIGDALLEHGAVLMRGFTVDTDVFSRFSDKASLKRLDYVYRSTPRDKIAEKVFTATKYPADLEIPMHCENSYQRDWPTRLMFYCAQPPSTGGETPLADMRGVTNAIGTSLLDKFETLGVKYVRNYAAGVDLSWRDVFQTSDRTDVERYCSDNDISFEWSGRDNLRTSQTCHGVSFHPNTGEKVFFNQGHLFHYTSVGEKNAATMLKVFGEGKLPRNAYFGDGTAIDDRELSAVRDAFSAQSKSFTWRKDDLLVLDNMQIAHGRRAFTGSRTILVSMSDPYSESVRGA